MIAFMAHDEGYVDIQVSAHLLMVGNNIIEEIMTKNLRLERHGPSKTTGKWRVQNKEKKSSWN